MAAPRILFEGALAAGERLTLDPARASYLATVLRRRAGEPVHLFNARDGEWAATIVASARRVVEVLVGARLRPPAEEPGPTLVFAPIRKSRMDWLVEKAVELGVRRLTPVLTAHSVVKLENPARLGAIATEAAEQCGRLTVPTLDAPVPLARWLAGRDPNQRVVLADETCAGPALLEVLPARIFVVGPEGGFAAAELATLRAAPNLAPATLGPRILRAETAALALLTAALLTAPPDTLAGQ